MGVRRGRYDFTSHKSLDIWDPLSHGGVYLISSKVDTNPQLIWYKPLYFGETKNFSERVTSNHEKYNCWKEYSNQTKLYICTHRDDSECSRKLKEEELRGIYKLPCNSM